MADRGSTEAEQKADYYEEKSHVVVKETLGGLATFNANYGYLEAMVRGFRSGFLRENEYRQLAQCATLEDVKLSFGDTDFCNVLTGVNKLSPDTIVDACEAKTVAEFEFLRKQAVGPLATFLDSMTQEHLIKNISFLISGLIKGGDGKELLQKCDPFGLHPRLKSITTFENSSDGLLELYRTVLVDLPVAKYFEAYFDAEISSDEPLHSVEQVYNEVEVEVIQNMLQKLWLEDFYRYCKSLGGDTAAMMEQLLGFEADRRAIAITINSFRTSLNDAFARDSERKALFCNFGSLYPEGIEALSKVGDMQQLGEVLSQYDVYRRLWARQQDGKTFLDALYEYEVRLNRLAFEGQSHFAVFWAFMKLKAQEKRNLWWIASCIHSKSDAKMINRWIPIF